MSDWQIAYCEDVEKWLDVLDKQQLKSVAKELKLLEFSGNKLQLPHSRSLGSALFELRERRFGLRMYYCFGTASEVYLLAAGDKSNQERDIKKARDALKGFQSVIKKVKNES